MRFAPFGFENNVTSSVLPSGLQWDLWQGNYTANASTWVSTANGTITATMLAGGFAKTTNGVTGLNFTGTTLQKLFTVPTGTWDSNAGGTLIIYMNITSTTNKDLWCKQTTSSNGMGVDFTNNPLYFVRAATSSNQITTTANTSRGTHVYSFATNGGNDQTAQYYLDKTAPTMSYSSTTNTSWNNGYDFIFGYGYQWTDPSIQGVLNRIMFFNRKLSAAEVSQVVDYCTTNA